MADALITDYHVRNFFANIGVDVALVCMEPAPDDRGYYTFMLDDDGKRLLGPMSAMRQFQYWTTTNHLLHAETVYNAYRYAHAKDLEAGNATYF